uniref:Serine/threonine-protein kinase ATM n=1 Tax=Rhizophora mucronata TaxID=61149 RepID=A0A2P2JCU5_RHIMU
MVSSKDVQEIVTKLSSDKAKAREEGVKLLSTWLEGGESVQFCKYIAQETTKLKPNDLPHSETWPFLVKLLVQCVSSEISGSKRRSPKIAFAKILRIVIQRAEDAKPTGKMLSLLPVVKMLFSHVLEVLSNVPSFQSEYGIILRHLLEIKDYRFHLRSRVYFSLVFLCMEKVETSLGGQTSSQCNSKEDVFRCILTLHSLLENPPGDFPDDEREGIVKGFMQIFSFVREEGKISRKLIECINTYLLKDGPNLGCVSLEIHNAVWQFMFHCWITTHDRGHKDALIFYARLQLNLTRGAAEGSFLVEQLLDVLCKELDQSTPVGVVALWMDATKDGKVGTLSGSKCGLVELAALVLYRACVSTAKTPSTEKRVKRENAAVLLKGGLVKGKWLWNAAFCCLIRNYYSRMSKDLFLYWFEGISTSFERIVSDANMEHVYDGLLWTLRSLQELSTIFLLSDCQGKNSSSSPFMSIELNYGWHSIWRSLMHGLPVFSNETAVVDAALVLLGGIISNDQMNSCVVPPDVWDLELFKQSLSMSTLYFIACYFSNKGSQGDVRDSLHLRKNLLRGVLGYLNWKESSPFNEQMVMLLPAAVYALCAGCDPFTRYYRWLFQPHLSADISEAAGDWFKTDEHEHGKLCDFFDCFVEVLASIRLGSSVGVSSSQCHQTVRLPWQLRDPLLHEMDTFVLGALANRETENWPLSDVLFLSVLVSNFVYGALKSRKREVVSSFLSKMGWYLLELLDHAVNVIQENSSDFQSLGCSGSSSECYAGNFLQASFRSFVCCPIFIKRENEIALDIEISLAVSQSMERLLKALAKLYEQYSETGRHLDFEPMAPDLSTYEPPLQVSGPLDGNGSRIVDMELDVDENSKDMNILTVGSKISSGVSFSTVKWKLGMISLISSFFSVVDSVTWDVLFELMEKECDTKVCENILCHLCQYVNWSSSAKIRDLVRTMNKMFEMRVSCKLDCAILLVAANQMLGTLSSVDHVGEDADLALRERESGMSLVPLGDLVHKIGECGLLDWAGRVKLIDCICDLVLLSPQIGQTMIERLLLLLRDPDYRVRFSLAQRVGVLFQTWDGHEELFQDICLNFGVLLVLPSKGKLVTAKDVLAVGPQPRPILETVILTLMYLALHSEKIELEVFCTSYLV